MAYRISVSVRALVEHSFRSGDLDLLAFSGEYTRDPLRIHQMIQRQRPSEYAGEVTISKSIDKEDLSIDIRGRIDGVYTYPDRIIIDEIKTTTENPELIACNKSPLHWGQAKCYAYLYSSEHHLKEITVQLTYYNIETHDHFVNTEG